MGLTVGCATEAPSGPDKCRRHVPSTAHSGQGARSASRPIVAATRQSSRGFQALKTVMGVQGGPECRSWVVPSSKTSLRCIRLRSRLGVEGDCLVSGPYHASTWPFVGPKIASSLVSGGTGGGRRCHGVRTLEYGWGGGGRKIGPRRSRETEFIGWGSRRRWQPEVAKFTPGLFAATFGKSKKGRRLSPRFYDGAHQI